MPYAEKSDQKEYEKAWRLANKEYVSEQAKAYYFANKKYMSERRKAYYLKNKSRINEWNKTYRIANKEQIKISDKTYRQANKEAIATRWRKRRALKLGIGHEPYKDGYIFERDGWVCGICDRKINRRLKHPNPLSPSIDHIVPLSKGGNDNLTNVQAAHLRCNVGKHNKNIGQLRLVG